MNKKRLVKIVGLVLGVLAIAVSLSACENAEDWQLTMKAKTGNLPLIISTYDTDGQKIDQVKAKSVDIHTDDTMSKTDSEGNQLSSVIDVDFGVHRMVHVGSTLIAYEGLHNFEDSFTKHIKIDDMEKSVPFLTRMYQDYKNAWDGQSSVVMVRSQSGKPIAVFAGNHVSIHQNDMKNATSLVVDGHRLLIYRADYTIYPLDSIRTGVGR